ncbi:MAG: tRNA-intron lyase [Archaeoglobaceae archaeon]|nr:tRNA-intron lyase [Archaeoglobaceae archaeon]MDW7989567.1 tRNA-intron lyase [Archaeoglobaceae archaeon]
MRGEIFENFAVLDLNRDLERGGFGQKKGKKIFLHPIEALYLQLNGKANFGSLEDVIEWVQRKVENFPEIYFVYEDLRRRGKKVKLKDDLIFTRKAFLPISESDKIIFEKIKNILLKFKEVVLAIVDEEREVTYYSVREPEMQGEQRENLQKFRGIIFSDRVITEDLEVFRKYFYGSEICGFVVLSLLESVYFLEKGVLEVENADKILQTAKKINGFEKKLQVYRDLKKRKFVVKTGFKFGNDFRVYRKVESLKELPHSEFLISVVEDRIDPKELSRAIRIANSVRKKLILAWNCNYFIFEWVKI